jgi:single-strand DNA-binding protein
MSDQGINRVLLSGILTRDPEVLELFSGTAVCVLRLACPGKRRVPGGSRQGPGELSVVVLGPTARRMAPYLYRGRHLVVQGRVEMERWEVGEGPEREAVCIVAERIHFAGNAPRHAEAFRRPQRSSGGVDAGAVGEFTAGFSEEMWC